MLRVLKKLLLYPLYCPVSKIAVRQIDDKPHYTKVDVITFGNSEGSDQTAHPHSLARTFPVRSKKLSFVP